jgi:hypothetical protein
MLAAEKTRGAGGANVLIETKTDVISNITMPSR